MMADNVASQQVRRTIVDAALAELAATGVDRFSIDRVAARVGVSPSVITDTWHDRRILLMDAVLSRAGEHVPVPDTGTLRGDLTEYVNAQIEYHSNERLRALFYAFLPNHSDDLDGTQVRPDFWNARVDRLSMMLTRAGARGELRDGVDPIEATRMLCAAVNFDTVYTDGPVRPDYVAVMLEIFIRGISP